MDGASWSKVGRAGGKGKPRLGASVLGRHGGVRGRAGALVPLAGVLLAEHLRAHPEVTPHLEVEAALRAGVTLGVAEAVVHDAHGLCAGERKKEREGGREREEEGERGWYTIRNTTVFPVFVLPE